MKDRSNYIEDNERYLQVKRRLYNSDYSMKSRHELSQPEYNADLDYALDEFKKVERTSKPLNAVTLVIRVHFNNDWAKFMIKSRMRGGLSDD